VRLTGRLRQETVNGLRQACFDQGEGELVLLLHGFPDTPHTWAQLAPAFVSAGYRVAAPFLRGYPPSGAPADDAYSARILGQDVIAWLDVLGAERAIVVGHDWGAFAAYAAANLAPVRLRKLVTLAIPHPGSLRLSLRVLRKSRHFVTFQLRGRTLARLERDDFEGIRALCHEWSPGWRMSDEDLALVKETLGVPGALDAALGYYRDFRRDAVGPRGRETRQLLRTRTTVPTLAFFGEDDGALDQSGIEGTRPWFEGGYSLVRLAGVGHFIHREVPDLFLTRTLEFLSQTAGEAPQASFKAAAARDPG
jgi:pimeloyl-ACP methyl ester carboxylesterase